MRCAACDEGRFLYSRGFCGKVTNYLQNVFPMFLFDTSMLIYIFFSIYMYCMVFGTVSKIKIRKVSDTASSTMLQKISCSVKDLELQNDLKKCVTIFKVM